MPADSFENTFSFYGRVVLKPHWRLAALAGALMLVSATLDMMTIGITVPLMDAITHPVQAVRNPIVRWVAGVFHLPTDPNLDPHVIFALLALACLLFAVRSAFYLLHRYVTILMGLRLRRQLKAALFRRFLQAPYETLTQWARGTVIQRINDPADAISTAIGQLGNLFSSVIHCAVMIGLLMVLSWWATLAVGLSVLVALRSWRRFSGPRAEAHGRTLFENRGEQNRIEVDAVDGVKVVKAHGLEEKMVALQSVFLRAEVRPTSSLELFGQCPTLVNEFSASLLVLGLGALTFLVPSLGLRFSMLVAFLLAIRRIAPAVSLINQASIGLSSLRPTLQVVEEVLYRLPQERMGGQSPGRVGEVRFDRVSFSYRMRPGFLVLQEVSVVFSRGTVTALVGATGAGKSTLAQLLLGLHEPNSGSILVNGVEFSQIDLAAWRRKIGYVSQDIFVFNTTIRENVALWGGAQRPEIERALRVAQLHDFVASLPDGYETVVGDRGLRLSGGQCQRLAIARAILQRPEVLIFDEATSALDNITERAVHEAIQATHQESIVIVIAHRLSTVREADQILVLQSSRIAESGSHEELMRRQGVYAKLYHVDGQGTDGGEEASPVSGRKLDRALGRVVE
jgi:subfamily B ATP-binding cassette protein MsbA